MRERYVLTSFSRTAMSSRLQPRIPQSCTVAFGNQNDWGPKGVYIRLPDVRWTIAGIRNFPHGTQILKNNNFDGQNCVHFLRTMSEAERNDPKDGVKNQKCIRELWKKMTGQEIGEDIE